jgi:dihydropteroate synthase
VVAQAGPPPVVRLRTRDGTAMIDTHWSIRQPRCAARDQRLRFRVKGVVRDDPSPGARSTGKRPGRTGYSGPGMVPLLLMGVVNVTPDSFSDGGLYLDAEAAVEHGELLAGEGADILDVGGESTRPGAAPVSEEEELRRVVPVVERLAGVGPRISIDTTKVVVARAALEAGAEIVNDVSAFRFDPALAGLVAEEGVDCCLMHMLGDPRTMQEDPRYDDVVAEVKAFLEERLAFAVGEGVPEDRVWLDPGIGFGKTAEHNLELLRRLDEIVAIGRPVVVGTSRKSFLGKLTGGRPEGERLPGTIATNVVALERGASVFRVHDVAQVRDALLVAAATFGS